IEWRARDGDRVSPGQVLGVLRGSARGILVAERIMLNFMQRMSGIASATADMVAALQGLPTRVLETRKTAP
ncbi:Nicotinate-nucleotide pyrophosphorylase [carboxylating], partial [Tetrabaena socialis]